jgi:putative FmdB family regulatory protein
MPIYEYECQTCHHQFELLVLPQTKTTMACPSCQGVDLERLLSGFAVSSDSTRQSNLQAARKRYASSSNLKDKKIAESEDVREHLQHDYGVDLSKKPTTTTGQK